MACEEEQDAYETAKQQVLELRQQLSDYTGSDKPGDGVPSGNWPEGANEANAELADIRARLENALEELVTARMVLNRCRRGNTNIVNVGVLLEDRPKDKDWMRTTLAHDSSLDFVIEPHSVEKMFEFILHLGKQGRRIKKLVLMGHGGKYHKHIGRLQPNDIDVEFIKQRAEKIKSRCQEDENTIALLKKQMESTDDPAERQRLAQKLAITEADLDIARFDYEEAQKQLQRFAGLADVMDTDALIGLFNCYAAKGEDGKAMMRNLGKIFLEKRGGRVVGCDGLIWVIHSKPLIAWLTGTEDIVALPFGDWVQHAVRGGRCGVPCMDFERYGYCDNRRSKDGGTCWRHR